jgi:hypothetical protein
VLTYYVIGFDPSFERWEFVFFFLYCIHFIHNLLQFAETHPVIIAVSSNSTFC